MAAWRGPRHRSWLRSDTSGTTVLAVGVLVAYFVWDWIGTAPQGMVTLVGLAGGALFGAVTSDKKKREADVENTATRAEAKADALTRVAASEHPDDIAAEPVLDSTTPPPPPDKAAPK